jgi:hypothetical protein
MLPRAPKEFYVSYDSQGKQQLVSYVLTDSCKGNERFLWCRNQTIMQYFNDFVLMIQYVKPYLAGICNKTQSTSDPSKTWHTILWYIWLCDVSFWNIITFHFATWHMTLLCQRKFLTWHITILWCVTLCNMAQRSAVILITLWHGTLCYGTM